MGACHVHVHMWRVSVVCVSCLSPTMQGCVSCSAHTCRAARVGRGGQAEAHVCQQVHSRPFIVYCNTLPRRTAVPACTGTTHTHTHTHTHTCFSRLSKLLSSCHTGDGCVGCRADWAPARPFHVPPCVTAHATLSSSISCIVVLRSCV